MGGRSAHPSETSAFKRGESYPCWYDPWDPSQAVLRKQIYKPFYFGAAIPLFFLLIGGSMLARSLRPAPSVKPPILHPSPVTPLNNPAIHRVNHFRCYR